MSNLSRPCSTAGAGFGEPARASERTKPLLAFVVLFATCNLVAHPSAHAGAFVVDRTDDAPAATACTAAANDCSLRGAVLAANALPGESSTITVPAGTYTLSQSVSCTYLKPDCGLGNCNLTTSQTALCLSAPITIQGDTAATTIIDGTQLGSVVLVSGLVTTELRDVTLTHGRQLNASYGGGGADNYGQLTITRVTVNNNSAALGGGVYTKGLLNVAQSTISNNFTDASGLGEGGGIFVDQGGGSATIVESTFVDNTAELHGGGLDLFEGNGSVRDSTFTGNGATSGNGGAIQTFGTQANPVTLVVTNSTISDNHADGGLGGGINVNPNVTVHLQSVTIAGNAVGHSGAGAGGGGFHLDQFGTLTMRNTIVAGNTLAAGASAAGPDCHTGLNVSVSSEGYNLFGSTDACTIAGTTTGNQLNVDPKLAPLADNGGLTKTRTLLPGSPAIDAANPAGCTDDQSVALTQDQRGQPRVVDGDGDTVARCDIGAVEDGASGTLTVTNIQPTHAGNGGTVLVVVHGSGFADGATIKLVRNGETDIVGTGTAVGASGQIALTHFDLTGKTIGDWQLVVDTADTTPTFTIETAQSPDLWVDIVGRPTTRGKTMLQRYLLTYGNRGNTDALAVPLVLAFPESVDAIPHFDIAPPPQQFGKITILEWGIFYTEIVAGENPPLVYLIMLVPIVPAGSSNVLEVILSGTNLKIGEPITLTAEIAQPLVDESGPKADAVAQLVQGAHDKSADVLKFTLPTTIDPDLTAYMNAALQAVVDAGGQSLLASFGTSPGVFSLTQLGFDLASFGFVWAELNPPAAVARRAPPWPDPPSFLAAITDAVGGVCSVSTANAQLGCVCGEGACGIICCERCSCPKCDQDSPLKPPKPCLVLVAENVFKGQKNDTSGCKRPTDPGECRDVGFSVIRGLDNNGKKATICTNDPRCILSNPVGKTCIRFDITPLASLDPNDKSGPAGGGAAHFITDKVPLQYSIQFENKPDATVPAAEVVITDQLDPAKVDLTSLSLGPISFGATQVVPPPGSTTFHHDVDLRPDNDLIVRITVGLDQATHVLSWDLQSLDPNTMLPPDDPSAGFLPPNVTPPLGDGLVAFTVAAKPGLTTGTEISNQARIVFDTNDPIDTPIWVNTIDVSPPTSSILTAAASGPCAQSINATWSGTDQGGGIDGFHIRATENGGPLVERLVTSQTSGSIPAKWGATYTFQSVAEDLAGNVETAPLAPGSQVVMPDCGPFDLAVTKIAVKGIKLTTKKLAQTALVKVEIQNRSAQSETIADETVLADLVKLTIEPLVAGCPAPVATLHVGKPQKPLPVVLASTKKLVVAFDAVIDCAIDHAKGAGHEDFRLTATVDQTVLGGTDAHAADDVCPRPGAKKPTLDPFPNGKIKENGCGPKGADGLPGGDVLLDVQAP
jgi:hypothetical protein